MLIVIAGENGSGKSAYAEKLALAFGGERRYIATMLPYGEEGAKRVEKHRRQRAGMGFTALELPYEVGGAEVPADAVVLLEDVSNLLANAMFERGKRASGVLEDIQALMGRCRVLIAVTIAGLDARACEGETRGYAEALGSLNGALCALADTVIEMRAGRPALQKGGGNALV